MPPLMTLLLSILLLTGMLAACEGEISTNANATGDAPFPVQNDPNDNDDFFHATRKYLGSSTSDTLSITDTVDYFFVELPIGVYRSYRFELTGLTGDADIELINAYLNKESWSDNADTQDELIEYWRDYTDLDNNIVYLKVTNRSDNDVMYTLEIQ
jgi:hypothetical protein